MITTLNNISQQFYNVGEIFAGAMFENEDLPIFDRMSHAYAEYWSRKTLPAYNGEKLYPCGPLGEPDYAVTPSASYVYTVDKERLDKKDPALFGYLKEYEELMKKPSVSGSDLIEAGIEISEKYSELLDYAHRLHLHGVEKDEALIRTLEYAKSLK